MASPQTIRIQTCSMGNIPWNSSTPITGSRNSGGWTHFKFEHYIANLFRRLGYAAKVTARSGDIGVDVLLKKDGKHAVVQCKRYGAEKCIGFPEIQQFVGSMQIYRVPQGFFMATTRFTPPAIKLATAAGSELINDAQLALLIRKTFPTE